jgi:hypothetical protein
MEAVATMTDQDQKDVVQAIHRVIGLAEEHGRGMLMAKPQ